MKLRFHIRLILFLALNSAKDHRQCPRIGHWHEDRLDKVEQHIKDILLKLAGIVNSLQRKNFNLKSTTRDKIENWRKLKIKNSTKIDKLTKLKMGQNMKSRKEAKKAKKYLFVTILHC